MSILMDIKKSFDQIQHSYPIKTLSKLGRKGNFLNLIKGIYKKPTVDIIFIGKDLLLSP